MPAASRNEPMTLATIYIARHASPDWTRTDIAYDRPPGPPLTPQGEKEAFELGEHLHSCGIAQLYASPLERARRTAELAAQIIGIQPQIENAIAEWRRDETADLVARRVMPFWEGIIADSLKVGPICLVTHGGPMRLLLRNMGLTSEHLEPFTSRFDHQNPAPPAGLWRSVYDDTNEQWEPKLVFIPQQED